MNTQDYIKEGERKLTNTDHYEKLDHDPRDRYNKYINHLIDQAWETKYYRKKHKTKSNLITKNPRISTFYMLHKIQTGNPGRPIVNGMDSVTEKIYA